MNTLSPWVKLTKTDAILFDVDGTLADCEHRRNFVAIKPKNWKAFFSGIPNDPPIDKVVKEAQAAHEAGHIVLIVTARPENTKQDTIDWLAKHNINYTKIYFRGEKDNRDDVLVKSEIYDQILLDGYVPALVYDDRPKVIRMWQSKGLEVVDCGQGIEF